MHTTYPIHTLCVYHTYTIYAILKPHVIHITRTTHNACVTMYLLTYILHSFTTPCTSHIPTTDTYTAHKRVYIFPHRGLSQHIALCGTPLSPILLLLVCLLCYIIPLWLIPFVGHVLHITMYYMVTQAHRTVYTTSVQILIRKHSKAFYVVSNL